MESARRRSKQKRAVSAHSTSHPDSEWYLEEGEAETPDLTQGTGIRLWGCEASELQRT